MVGGMHRTAPALENIVIAERIQGKSQRECAVAAGIPGPTAQGIIERHAETIEASKRDAQNEVLLEMNAAVRARMTDSKTADSRTGAQSLKVVCENILGWAPQRGPLVAIDNRSVHVNVEAGQVSALSGKTAAELEEALSLRMAELAGD